MVYYNRSKGEQKQEKREKKMKINSIMKSEIRNSANGGRARKLQEYTNKEKHMNQRVRSNKNAKG